MKGYHVLAVDLDSDAADQWIADAVDGLIDEISRNLRLRSEFLEYLQQRGEVE